MFAKFQDQRPNFNEKSRAKQRGTSNRFEVFRGLAFGCPSCLAGYFPWPQVALTHHAFRRWLYASADTTVKFQYWDAQPEECLVFYVTMTFVFRMTGSSEANKYNVFSNLQP